MVGTGWGGGSSLPYHSQLDTSKTAAVASPARLSPPVLFRLLCALIACDPIFRSSLSPVRGEVFLCRGLTACAPPHPPLPLLQPLPPTLSPFPHYPPANHRHLCQRQRHADGRRDALLRSQAGITCVMWPRTSLLLPSPLLICAPSNRRGASECRRKPHPLPPS